MIPSSLDALTIWLEDDRRTVTGRLEGFSVSDEEVTLDIRRVGGAWVVFKTWRDQNRGVVFIGASDDDVDRYLTLAFANDKRNARGLRPLRHSLPLGDAGQASPVDGFALTGDLDRGFLLTDNASGRAWTFASDIEAARYSRYAGVPVKDLRRRVDRVARDLLDGDGSAAAG